MNICADENYTENDVACLTTTGDIIVLSLPHLRQQMKVEGIRCDSRSVTECFPSVSGATGSSFGMQNGSLLRDMA